MKKKRETKKIHNICIELQNTGTNLCGQYRPGVGTTISERSKLKREVTRLRLRNEDLRKDSQKESELCGQISDSISHVIFLLNGTISSWTTP